MRKARLNQINKRLQEIRKIIEERGENLDETGIDEINSLTSEVSELTSERANLLALEQRDQLLNTISNGAGLTIRQFNSNDNDPELGEAATPQYRSAWLKTVRGIPLTEVEQRIFTSVTESGSAVVPTQTANQIITRVVEIAPMINEIELLHVAGHVKFAVEKEQSDAEDHAEGASISSKDADLVPVDLGGFEIVKLVTISESVKTMSIDAFESWIVTMLSNAIARAIENRIFNGTGSAQATGVEKANTWDETNSVTVASAESLTLQNVLDLVALLPSGYDATAKIAMNKRTLMRDFMPLMDKAKHNIVQSEGGKYFILGYEVIKSDKVKDHEAYLGAFKKYIGNMPNEVTIRSQYDIDTNSYKYSGVAMFDGKPAFGEAFVKLVKGV